jgi:hypothetical protein
MTEECWSLGREQSSGDGAHNAPEDVSPIRALSPNAPEYVSPIRGVLLRGAVISERRTRRGGSENMPFLAISFALPCQSLRKQSFRHRTDQQLGE